MRKKYDQNPTDALGNYGITKTQHDARVAETGRPYTDDLVAKHRQKESAPPA